MDTAEPTGACPFCDFVDADTYILMLHVETLHSEGESPFVVREGAAPDMPMELDFGSDNRQPVRGPGKAASSYAAAVLADGYGNSNSNSAELEYVVCSEETCGEAILLSELDAHIDMHVAERTTLESADMSLSEGSRGPDSSPGPGAHSGSSNSRPPQPADAVGLDDNGSDAQAESLASDFSEDDTYGTTVKIKHVKPHRSKRYAADTLRATTRDGGQGLGSRSAEIERKLPKSGKGRRPASPVGSSSGLEKGWKSLLLGGKSGGKMAKAARLPPHQGNIHSRRLGKAELGPFAHEKQMPVRLKRLLEADGRAGAGTEERNIIGRDGKIHRVRSSATAAVVANEAGGIVPVLVQLCAQDPTVRRAYFCDPCVRHVFRLDREGGFCGYRNIQMLMSYVRHQARADNDDGWMPSLSFLRDGTPGILRLQDMIEEAWDRGYNSIGRIETGGIKGTRKYIGTSEAQALFLSLGIPCEGQAFSEDASARAHERLLSSIEEYFTCGYYPPLPASTSSISSPPSSMSAECKVFNTSHPPVYLQHPGHSLTIVGLEYRTDGSRTLLAFDPMFKPSPGILRLIGKSTFTHRLPGELLLAYRRGERYLGRYDAFETLQ